MDKPREAAAQYVEAIRRRPNALDDGRENALDQAIATLKRDPSALQSLLAAYQEAAVKRPKDAAIQSAIGRVSAARGDRDAVQVAFARAIELAPDDLKIRQQYTSVLSQTQQYAAALQQAQSALQLAQSQQRKDEVDRLTKMVENLERQRAGGS